MSKKLIRMVAVAGLLALSLLLASAPSEALPSNEVEIFYLDGNGAVVGYFFRGCDGQRISWGLVTTNKMSYSASCSTSTFSLGCMWNGGYLSCAANMFWDLCTDHYSAYLCSV